MKDRPHILLINPWIHDFAAYDFWAKPLGLLMLAAMLRTHDMAVSYIDCLDRFHPRAPAADPHLRWGRGPYLKTRIQRPAGLNDVPRRYSRYGIQPDWFREDLEGLSKPDLVLLTSLMTYWYPGLQETVSHLRTVFDDVPVVLGGTYATLCREHARTLSGVDHIVAGPGEKEIFNLLPSMTGAAPVRLRFDPQDPDSFPFPALDLQRRVNYVPLLTSQGCPFSCPYCASKLLNPGRRVRSPESVMEEILYWHGNTGVRDFVFYDGPPFATGLPDFVFYDDALLQDAEAHFLPLLERLVRKKLALRFHTPNALHVRWLKTETALLMQRAGFRTIRLGLETAEVNGRRPDRKLRAADFERAVKCLKKAGFGANSVGAYLLVGLPGQRTESVIDSIRIVKRTGVTPVLAYYSPIPHTELWDAAVRSSRYDLETDPVYTNNAILPCRKEAFSWETITYLKDLTSS